MSVQGEPDCGTLGGGNTSSSVCPRGEKDAILEFRQVWGALRSPVLAVLLLAILELLQGGAESHRQL